MENTNNPTIKSEPGTSGSCKRLPTFRGPRDLKLSEFQKMTLGSASKKVYMPNLNVQRKKPVEEVPKVPEKPPVKVDEKVKKEKPKKKTVNYIQSSGVFSEGLAPSIKTGRWTSRYSESSETHMLPMPKLKKEDIKVDKHEEENVVKELLREDFIDDPTALPDLKFCPVRLPLKTFEGDIYKKEEDEDGDKKIQCLNPLPTVKVKEEPMEGDFTPVPPAPDVPPRTISEMAPLTIEQLLRQSTEKSFVFFQLPNVLPKQKFFVPSGQKGKGVPAANTTSEEPEEKSILRKLPAGRIGKLQILKSGRARLVLGDVKFILEAGTQPAFKQEIMAVELNSSNNTGDMINMGNITTRMIVSPDWKQILSN